MKKQETYYVKNGDIEIPFVHCAVCHLNIGLNVTSHQFGIMGLAWYDTFNKSMYYHTKSAGCYVHLDCLSEKQKQFNKTFTQ